MSQPSSQPAWAHMREPIEPVVKYRLRPGSWLTEHAIRVEVVDFSTRRAALKMGVAGNPGPAVYAGEKDLEQLIGFFTDVLTELRCREDE